MHYVGKPLFHEPVKTGSLLDLLSHANFKVFKADLKTVVVEDEHLASQISKVKSFVRVLLGAFPSGYTPRTVGCGRKE